MVVGVAVLVQIRTAWEANWTPLTLMVFEPVVAGNVVGVNLMEFPAPDVNVALFGACAKASGDRNETPAARTSRKRKARGRRREIPVHATSWNRGGGVSCGRYAFRRLFLGPRLLPPRLSGSARSVPLPQTPATDVPPRSPLRISCQFPLSANINKRIIINRKS